MQTPPRPLGIVKEIVEEIGHEITYAYDDIVFMEHNDFLLLFSDNPSEIALYINTECDPGDAAGIEAKLLPAGRAKGLSINKKGTYKMTEQEGDNLRITFSDNP